MYVKRERYGYNYIGLLAASIGIPVECSNRFYCSEFVRYILRRYFLIEPDSLEGVVKPIDFLKISKGQIVYRGKLRNFSPRPALKASPT